MEITLLIGAAPYRLGEGAARRLEETIREACLDDAGQPLTIDDSVRACLQLADALRDDLEQGSSAEPIELGYTHAEGLCVYVLRDDVIAGENELAALYFGCQRLRRDPA